jgi:hypothetical protein
MRRRRRSGAEKDNDEKDNYEKDENGEVKVNSPLLLGFLSHCPAVARMDAAPTPYASADVHSYGR